MKPIYELSRRARLRQFGKLAQVSLTAFGMAEAQQTFVQYNENVIYRVDVPGPETNAR